MYPYFRALKSLFDSRFHSEKISIDDSSVIKSRVWLSDIDIYAELNNGRHLTLMDLGRYNFGQRVGLFKVLKEKNWGLMVAGNFTRYRHRLLLFQKFDIKSELIAYDERWFYFYQQTLRKNKVHSAALIRTAVTSRKGLVPTQDVADCLNIIYSPNIPEWIEEWIKLNDLSPEM